MDSKELVRRVLRFFAEYGILIVILVIGAIIWIEVFEVALEDYLSSDYWNSRSVWLGGQPTTGPGSFEIFGFTIQYQFVGYGDYSFFYVHWGHNMLNGVMPYCDEFGYLEMDGIINQNGIYIFPPMTAIFYALGILIPVDNWGIGILIALCGYLTALPVYGLGKELSNNRHVGEVAALTYLLTPNVLYHITFLWTNPAPFYFFFFSGFYMLVKEKRHTGTLLIVVAALFKQTAWFLGIPLVIFLLLRSRPAKNEVVQEATKESASEKQSLFAILREQTAIYLNLKEFLISAIVVVLFVGAVMFPFMVAQPNFWSYMRLAAGGFQLESFTEPPLYVSPMRLQVLPVMVNMPTLAEILDYAVFSGGLLVLGVLVFSGMMFLEPKIQGKNKVFLRRILFFTMLMMLWVNLTGPRGVYKYYFTLMAPFFSIFSSANMASSMDEEVKFSISMLWVPILFSLMILVPIRNVYLAYVFLIFIFYLLSKSIGRLWHYITAPGRLIRRRVAPRMSFITQRLHNLQFRITSFLYPATVDPTETYATEVDLAEFQLTPERDPNDG
ncbi:MAG: hypothetical protein ACFFAY_10355 [Promethearchaeota archaeon]